MNATKPFAYDDTPRLGTPLLLIRLGAGIVAVALLASFWASPDRLASLPWFLITGAGITLVLVTTGHRLDSLARRIRLTHLAWFFGIATAVALGAALFTSRWPSYKLPWLNSVYAALPSIRSLPFSWAEAGLQPNQTGGILAVLTASMVAFALAPRTALRGVWRGVAIFLSIAGIFTVFLTGSRAALAALAAAVLFIAIVRTLHWLWVWGVGAVLAVLGLFASGALGTIIRFFLRDETLDTKLAARLDIWSSALRAIQDHFLTGIGLGVFNQVMPVRYPYKTVGLSYPVSQAHNLFLDVALSIGVPGAAGLLLVLVGCILLGIAQLRHESLSKTLAIAILGSVLAFLVFGITDSISFSTPTSFILWLWACSLAIISQRSVQAQCGSTQVEHIGACL